MPSLPPPEPAAIAAALDRLQLRCALRTSARGVPYAAFGLRAADGPERAFTALVENGVCRITVHGIAAAGQGPTGLEALRRGAALPFGAAYRSPDDGALELGVGYWLGPAPAVAGLAPEVLGPLLAGAQAGSAALLDGGVPDRPALPGRAAGGAALRAALETLGHRVVAAGDGGLGFGVTLHDGSACTLRVTEAADGWIEAAAALEPALQLRGTAAEEPLLQRLQRWTVAGRFTLAGDRPALGAQVVSPALGQGAAVAVWSCSQAVAMLDTALRHLRHAGGPN